MAILDDEVPQETIDLCDAMRALFLGCEMTNVISALTNLLAYCAYTDSAGHLDDARKTIAIVAADAMGLLEINAAAARPPADND